MVQTAKSHIRSSLRDGIWTNFAVGMGENYFTAFLLILGFSDVVSGMSAIIPLFMGTFLQLFSLYPYFRAKTPRKRIQFFLLSQALTFLPFIYLGWVNSNSIFLFYLVLTLYWASSQSLLPSWNLLMGHTIPYQFRIKFFSLRLQISQTSVVMGLLLSGFSLFYAKQYHLEKECFLIIFALCFLFKLLSWNEFRFHQDFIPNPTQEKILSPRQFFLKSFKTNQGNLILYLFLFYVMVHSSSPYYNPYMLKHLKFNYLEFMLMISVSFIGRILMSRILKKYARSKHVKKIFFFSCLGICITPLLWVGSQQYLWLIFIEILSGCYWAGFDLSLTILYFSHIKDEERSSVMTYIYFINTLGMCIGTLIGGWLLINWPFKGSNYLGLFILSSVVRLIVVFFEPNFELRKKILSWIK
jgi:MFS family permease